MQQWITAVNKCDDEMDISGTEETAVTESVEFLTKLRIKCPAECQQFEVKEIDNKDKAGYPSDMAAVFVLRRRIAAQHRRRDRAEHAERLLQLQQENDASLKHKQLQTAQQTNKQTKTQTNKQASN